MKYLSKYYTQLRYESKKSLNKALYWTEILANKNNFFYIKRMIFLCETIKEGTENKKKIEYWKNKSIEFKNNIK